MQIKKLKLIALLSCGLLASSIDAKSLIGQDLKVFNQATIAMSQHNWEQAEKLLSGLHNQFPKNDFISNNLAVIYFNQGRMDEAQELLSEIIRSTEATRTAFENLQTLYGYSAAKAYSKGLNLLKPIELPGMIVRNYDMQQKEVSSVAVKSKETPKEPLVSEETTSNDMVAMLNSDSNLSNSEPVETDKTLQQLEEQPVLAIPSLVEQEKSVESKQESLLEPTQDVLDPDPNKLEPIQEKVVAAELEKTSQIASTIEPVKDSVKDVLLVKLDSWAKAWSDGDVKAYIDFYSPSYSPRDKSRKAWLKNRRSRVKPSKKIRITISKQEVFVNKNKTQANILFEQKYRSKNYQDKVKKRITWIKRKGKWVIVKEVIIKTL